MFEIYLESIPYILNTMATAFGEVFLIEAYLRRIAHCKDEETRKVYEKLGLLYAVWNIVERGGEYREGNLITSDQLNQLKEKNMTLMTELRHEIIPLTQTVKFWDYNILAHEDFYERFLATVARAKGAFDRAKNWELLISGFPMPSQEQ